MERRLHMTSRDKTLMVEGSVKFDGRPGIEVLTQIRKYNPKFKYARIKDVIQAYPSKIELGKIYRTEEEPMMKDCREDSERYPEIPEGATEVFYENDND